MTNECIVLTYGTFDNIHHGHINFFKRAKALGTKLIVGLSSDRFNQIKGKECYFNYQERKTVLESISYIDEIFKETNWEQKKSDIEKYNANILVMGNDWTGKFDHFQSETCKVIYLDRDTSDFRPMSSTLIKKDFAERVLNDNDKIDIIVTYVDESVPGFSEEREIYKKKYYEAKYIDLNSSYDSHQATADCRFRLWDNFNYWFRCVENNIPWINKVFLVIKDKKHIPTWLNINHPKLRIICHDEFIPKELLPTYNVHTIEMFYANIKDLSNLYITSNDDFFFLNPVPKTYFSINGVAVKDLTKYKFRWSNENGSLFSKNLNNGHKLRAKLKNYKLNYMYHYTHLPELRCKKLEIELLETYYNDLYETIKLSTFRNKTNIVSSWFFIDMFKDSCNKKYPKINISLTYRNSRLYSIGNKYQPLNFILKDCLNKDMVCFNDVQDCSHELFLKAKEKLIDMFKNKFPNKCSFEL